MNPNSQWLSDQMLPLAEKEFDSHTMGSQKVQLVFWNEGVRDVGNELQQFWQHACVTNIHNELVLAGFMSS